MKNNYKKLLDNRLVYIDLLECIAIFLVIVYHSTLYSFDFLKSSESRYYVVYFFRTILSTCVPLFFFANGYLLFNKNFDLKKHLIKIVKLILLTGIWGIISLLLLQKIKNEYFSIIEFLKALWVWKLGWINHLWFMGTLVCIYIFFPLLKQVYDTSRKVFIYFTIVSFILTFGNTVINEMGTILLSLIIKENYVFQGINFFNIFNPFKGIYGYSFVYFCLGGLMYTIKNRLELVSVKKRNIVSVLGIFSSCLCLCIVGVCYSKLSGEIWDLVWNGYDTIFTFFNVIFIYCLCLNWKYNNKFIRTVSSNTLGIYFIHELIIKYTQPYIKEINIFCNIPINIIYAFFTMCLSLIICLIFRKIPIISKLVE